MTSNSKFHLQSISFAIIVLMFAMFSSQKQAPVEAVQVPRETELTATVVDAAAEVLPVGQQTEAAPVESSYVVEVAAAHEAAALDSEPAPSTQTTASNVVAAAFLAQEVGSGRVIGEYQSGYRWPVASITKLMTAVIALEKIGAEQSIIVSQAAVETEGDSGGFTAGEEFTVLDLIKAMMTVSSNDAAAAIADYVGTPRFFDLMQERAYDLKMTDTSFIDATGLSYLNQSTAQDVAKLIDYIYANHPQILEISKQGTNKITERASGLSRTLKNINTFAGTTGFMGGKTGFTDESKGNLVSLFQYNGKTYTLVVFGTTDRFVETRKLLSWLKAELAEN